MPKLPKNMFAFVDKDGKQKSGQAGLCDFETVNPNNNLPGNIVCNIAGIGDAVENELITKRLFLDTLTDMIREDGGTTDAAQAFQDAAKYFIPPPPRFQVPRNSDSLRSVDTLPRLYGSQIMLSLHRFDETPYEKKKGSDVGPPETTTRYGFDFVLPAPQKPAPKDQTVGYYKLDIRAFETLEKYAAAGVFKQNYLEGFVRMAGMAEHDYLHQLVSIIRRNTSMHYPGAMLQWDGMGGTSNLDLEQHVLALHAHICDRLFSEEKPALDGSGAMIPVGARRKDAVLKWAATEFKTISDMQDAALAHATTKQERVEIQEAVTYLAEIYAHRLFRVISPLDPDFKKPITLKGATAATSVAEQCDRMVFKVLPFLGRPVTEANSRGIAGLHNLCDIVLKDWYVESHTAETTQIISQCFELWKLKIPTRKEEMTHHMLVDRFVREGVPEMKWKKKIEEEAQEKGGTEIG